jgi:uncharacterized Zn-finger protein
MNACKSCGRMNDASSVFCRFCGTKFAGGTQQQQPQQFDYTSPRPYSWKTDEFQTKAGPRSPAGGPVTVQEKFAPLAPDDPRIRCPFCSSLVAPRIERKISTAGWITFALLLVFVFPLFWIGFLIKENVAYCPVCDAKLS